MPHSAHGPSSADDAHETYRLILQVAHRLFMEQGYRAVTTRQIAAECGITQPALYRHFATKQDLYVAMLLETLQLVHGRLTKLARRDESVSARLHLIARMLPGTWVDTQQMFHDIAHELNDEQRQLVANTFRQQIVQPIESLFTEGITQGILRDSTQGGLDATEATFVLLHLLSERDTPGLQSRSHLQHADRMVHILLHGLLGHAETEG